MVLMQRFEKQSLSEPSGPPVRASFTDTVGSERSNAANCSRGRTSLHIGLGYEAAYFAFSSETIT